MTDLLEKAIKTFENVESYTVTLRSEKDSGIEVIKYQYKKPGHIRMEFVTPHQGALLTYDPEEKKVRVRPFRSFKSFVLTFDPSSSFVKSPRGHRVDESDIGTLLRVAAELARHGSIEESGTGKIKGRPTDIITITGEDGYTVEKDVNKYVLYLERSTGLPLKAEALDRNGELIERVLMDDLEVKMR